MPCKETVVPIALRHVPANGCLRKGSEVKVRRKSESTTAELALLRDAAVTG